MDYPFNVLSEYFIKENSIDLSKEYEICTIPARQLIKYNRFDLMAKWLYIDAVVKKMSSKYGYHVYYDNINAFSCGTFAEPGSEKKNSFEQYIEELDRLIKSIGEEGFDASKSLIPVGMNDDIIDGSHRVAVAAYFNKKVSIIRFPGIRRTYSYDYLYFRKYLMSDINMGYMAIQYVHLRRNCHMACLWPQADPGRVNEVEKKLRSIGNIVYSQDVYLTYTGMRNLMIQIYGHQPWTGNIEDHFDGVCGKVNACYREGQPVKAYLFEAPNPESVIDVKRQIRDIFRIGNHSIHISDNWDEAVDMAELLFNRNSVDFMNKAMPYLYDGIYKKVIALKRLAADNGYDKFRFIIDSSAVLEVCGLRRAADLDFLTDYELELDNQIDGVDNHKSQLTYYSISLYDMLYSPESYFYFEGMKFIRPQRLVEMKMKRGEEKDFRDIKLLRRFIGRKNDIPIDYRYGTIDKIHEYQIEHRIYGEGPWSYAQYRKNIQKNRMSKIKAIVKSPLSVIWHCFIREKGQNRETGEREKYILFQRSRLRNTNLTIISSNCNGGVISSDLGMPFRSPFVNLFITASDYIKILGDLKGYLDEKLYFVREADPIYGDISYPTAYLKDVKLYFMHYNSEEEAQKAWDRRKKRINWDNMYVIFTDRSGCTMEDLRAFDKLPYKHKVVFTHIPQPEIKSAYYIKGYENEKKVGVLSDWQDEAKPVKRVYDQFDFVGWFNGEFEVGG